MTLKTNTATTLLVVLAGCSRADPPTATTQPIPSTAPIVSSQPAVPARQTVTLALFKGAELLTCTDVQATPDKIASFAAPEGMTKLNQRCDSLGRTALTTCTAPNVVDHYYHFRYSDKYMAACVQKGGQWQTNQNPEADLARAQQQLQEQQTGGK